VHIKTANGQQKLAMTKSDWEAIGKKAGWTAEASMESKSVKLNPTEIQLAEWALEPMEAYWCTELGEQERGDEEGGIFSPEELPRIEGNIITMSPVCEINQDFMYRIEDQLDSMLDDPGIFTGEEERSMTPQRSRRAFYSLTKKLRSL